MSAVSGLVAEAFWTLNMLLGPNYSGALAPAHRADLAKSRLVEETIQAQKIRSVPPAMIEPLLGFTPSITSAMLIPFADPTGGWMPHVRMKIFPALENKKGTIKYLQPKWSGVRLFFTLSTMAAVCTGAETLHVIEGEKKALSVSQRYGVPTVGICGIEGWHHGGTDRLLDDFDHIPLDGRVVKVYPDSDVETNQFVRRAVERFGEALVRRGAKPEVVFITSYLADGAASGVAS